MIQDNVLYIYNNNCLSTHWGFLVHLYVTYRCQNWIEYWLGVRSYPANICDQICDQHDHKKASGMYCILVIHPHMGLKYIGFGLWYPILRIPWPLRIQSGDYFQYSYPTFSNVMENIEHHQILNCIGAHHFHNDFDCNPFQLFKNSDWLLIVHTSISSFEIQETYLKKNNVRFKN